MSEFIGETFDATVNSITSFGMFCTLENTCEGLVPISEMPGLFTFDETNLTMRSRTKIYRISDSVKIRVEEASITRGKLRFSIVEAKKTK
jgi:ribonuclease R